MRRLHEATTPRDEGQEAVGRPMPPEVLPRAAERWRVPYPDSEATRGQKACQALLHADWRAVRCLQTAVQSVPIAAVNAR